MSAEKNSDVTVSIKMLGEYIKIVCPSCGKTVSSGIWCVLVEYGDGHFPLGQNIVCCQKLYSTQLFDTRAEARGPQLDVADSIAEEQSVAHLCLLQSVCWRNNVSVH